MSQAQVDRNLFIGVLALQMEFVTRDALLAAMKVWMHQKEKPIGEILVEQGSLAAGDFALLTAVAEEQAGRNTAGSWEHPVGLGSLRSLRHDLEQLADGEIEAGLQRLVTMQERCRAKENASNSSDDDETTSGRFEIVRPHAWGGLGEVYIAHDRELNREVALKRLQERHAKSADSLVRFLVEAEITAGLEHPGVVPVYGMGLAQDGRPYYAMRFIKGRTLKEAIERFHVTHPPPESERQIELRHLLSRFIAVCNAVEYAHSRGIIHRDLKPSNIMLGKFGETLVVDWGLAKSLGADVADRAADEPTLTPSSGSGSSETLPGCAIGTPGYMSPEQSAGRLDEVGPASDVFSLGVTLYVLLTGKEPFASGSAGGAVADVLANVQAGQYVPPRQVNAAVPAPLDAICRKALSVSPSDRYPTCAALASDIDRWLADLPVTAFKEPIPARLFRWIRVHRILAATSGALAAATFVGLVIGTALLSRANTRIAAEAERTEAQRRLAVARGDEVTRQRDLATRQLYASQINLAGQAWDDDNAGRVHELLESNTPANTGGVDLRGWEWNHLWRVSHSELRILKAESLCLAFSPDGRTLVAGCRDGTVKIWNAAATRAIRSFRAHEMRINVLLFSRDGRLLVTGSRDGTAKVWDATTGRLLETIAGHPTWEHGLALSPDGSKLAISFQNLVLFDRARGKSTVPLKGHTHYIMALAFLPDGRRLVSGAWDRTARLWDVQTGKELRKYLVDQSGCSAVAVGPDGRTLYTGSMDGVLQTWDLRTAKETGRLRLHSNKICRLVFSPDGKRLASSSDDTTAKIWNLTGPREIETLRGHGSPVTDLAFSPGGDVIATSGWDSTIRLWDAASRQEPRSLIPPTGSIFTSIAYSPDSRLLVSGGKIATHAWDASTGQFLWTAGENLSSFPAGTGKCFAFHPFEPILASAAENGGVNLRDPGDGRLIRRLNLPSSNPCASVDFSPDGKLLAGGDANGTIWLWEPNDGHSLGEWRAHSKSLTTIAFSPDGRYLASAGAESDGTPGAANDRVHLWDVPTRRRIRSFVGHEGVICSIVFSPHGRTLYTGGRDETIRAWDVETGDLIRSRRGHSGDVQSLSVSPDGTRLASGSDDRTVRIWDVATGQELETLRPQCGATLGVAFSPDGTRLAAACESHFLVKSWDARLLTAERRHELDAAELLATIAPHVRNKRDLKRRIRTSPLIEDVRSRALATADAYWDARTRQPVPTELRAFCQRIFSVGKTRDWTVNRKQAR